MGFYSIFTIYILTLPLTYGRNVALDEEWHLWKAAHKKVYSNVEEHHRRTIWENHFKLVERHNHEADLGIHTYWLEMNHFADLKTEEFVRILNGIDKNIHREHNDMQQLSSLISNAPLPDSVDWRKKGDVVAVKDQGQCGSCWAFSAVGSIESANAIKTGKLVSLSEQQLIDCSSKQGNMGCNGGLMDQAFKYVMQAGGIEAESVYPYAAYEKSCIFNASGVIVKVCGFIDIKPKNETDLEQTVANIGPTSVAIDASHISFQLYRNGIYDEPECSQMELDHGVLVVGYGTDSNKDYWLVKNSWGAAWGDQGYIKMSRNKNNQCGIATMASYPVIC